MILGAVFMSASFVTSSRADVEIDLADEETHATPVPAKAVQVEDDSDVYTEVYEEAPAPTPVPTLTPIPIPVHPVRPAKPMKTVKTSPAVKQYVGKFKMRDMYEAGIKSYLHQDYPQAIRYLKESLKITDPYTPDYYYAEANAMLGVIYQFYFTVAGSRTTAYGFYKEALRIDPETETAIKYINQVKPK